MEKKKMNLPKGPNTLCFDKDEFMKVRALFPYRSVLFVVKHLTNLENRTEKVCLFNRTAPNSFNVIRTVQISIGIT